MTRSENRNQLRTMRWSSSLVIAIVCFLVPLAAKAANSDAETEKVYGKKISDSRFSQGAFKRPHKPQNCFRHSRKNRHQTLLVESPNWRPERVKKYTAYELYRR